MLAEDVGRWPKTLSTDQKMLADSRNVLADVDTELADVGRKEIINFDWSVNEKPGPIRIKFTVTTNPGWKETFH